MTHELDLQDRWADGVKEGMNIALDFLVSGMVNKGWLPAEAISNLQNMIETGEADKLTKMMVILSRKSDIEA
jgi:hypothetical protein